MKAKWDKDYSRLSWNIGCRSREIFLIEMDDSFTIRADIFNRWWLFVSAIVLCTEGRNMHSASITTSV